MDLAIHQVREALEGQAWVREVRWLEFTSSTNDEVQALARLGEAEGVCVVAERQTAGRGRLGRVWESAQGMGLWFSVLLRPTWECRQIPRLTLTAGLAVLRAIEAVTKLDCAIKWPNDILINGKKTCGILTEAQCKAGNIDFAVVGIGINVNHRAEHLEGLPNATSLKLAGGSEEDISREAVLAQVLKELAWAYHQPFEVILKGWNEHCASMGQMISVIDGDERVEGQMQGLDEDGALLLRLESGIVRTVRSGEVVLG